MRQPKDAGVQSFSQSGSVTNVGHHRSRDFIPSLPALYLTAILAVLLPSPASHAQQTAAPAVEDEVGVDIHTVSLSPAELKTLSDSGVRWVRMDFDWSATERSRGEYDFRAYDAFLTALDSVHVRAILILAYRNALYDNGLSPASDEAREAFARWAAAAVAHFRGRGILWEMYNEPNAPFWLPRPNTDDYIKLALATGEAVEESAPDEKLIGPASGAIDPPFLEACFRAGLLNYWSAVSIHPYRPTDPETVADDLRNVRLLIRKYAPPGKSIPIIVSEWGYSAVSKGMDEQKQAERLAREWLVDIANDVPLTIWYDWRDDGRDSQNPEHHFGLLGAASGPAKPAYRAARALTGFLSGFRFNKRLALDQPEDYALLFTRGGELRLAAWTVGAPHEATVPASAGTFEATALDGEKLPSLDAGRGGLKVQLTTAPQYLAPGGPNPLLEVAAAWERLPLEIAVRTPADLPLHLHVKNPLSSPLRFSVKGEDIPSQAGPSASARPGAEATLELRAAALSRSLKPVTTRIELEAHGLGRLAQATWIVSLNPLRLTVLPATDNSLSLAIANPSGDPFQGTVRATGARGLDFVSSRAPLNLAPRSTDAIVKLPLARLPEADYTLGVEVVDPDGNIVLDSPSARFVRLSVLAGSRGGAEPAGYKLVSGGAESGAPPGEGGAAAALPSAGPPLAGMNALELTYRLPAAGASVRLIPEDSAHQQIPGKPLAIGLWLYGDASGVRPYVWIADSTGQIFEEGGGPVNWQGWRYVLIHINIPQGAYHGGANDGVIHYPIHWDSLLVLRNASKEEVRGNVYISSPTLIY